MNTPQKIWELVENEDFQDEIMSLRGCSAEIKQSFINKYSITESEFNYVQALLSGLTFRKKDVSELDVNYAYNRLKKRISLSSLKIPSKQNVFVWLTRLAAVLSIPLLLSTIYFYQSSRQKTAEYAGSVVSYNTFLAPMGAKTQIVLPDGSLVWLNSGSSLSYPSRFDSKSRDVSLKGEAYFEVVKNEKVPMYVTTQGMKVKVYGTKFNVNAYSDKHTVETTLVEGRVSILPDAGEKEFKLDPGYTATFQPESQKLKITKVDDMDAYTGWKDGKLIFRDERFYNIVKDIDRWYNVDIQVEDTSLYNYTLHATFIDENVEQVLDIFSNSIPISVEYPKRVIQPNGLYSKRVIIIKRNRNKKMILDGQYNRKEKLMN